MLKVIIEMHPFGSDSDKQCLSEIFIVNDGTGNRDIGNYSVFIYHPKIPSSDGKRRSAEVCVRKFSRKLGAQALVSLCLQRLHAKKEKLDKKVALKPGQDA